MIFQIEYKDGEGLDQIIHLVSKNTSDAINESHAIARCLAENKIYEWAFRAVMKEQV